ncbi:Hypothetical_protein [Hexamita inflata]|uniref:Hypothetical_protein n=1 Tax=Hexamita inflata TaxID=28002 RepID=A0AA86UQU0_9EUKA|nr:Hypothetical protein HINF_LOCUS34953 [Hexamita inflata]
MGGKPSLIDDLDYEEQQNEHLDQQEEQEEHEEPEQQELIQTNDQLIVPELTIAQSPDIAAKITQIQQSEQLQLIKPQKSEIRGYEKVKNMVRKIKSVQLTEDEVFSTLQHLSPSPPSPNSNINQQSIQSQSPNQIIIENQELPLLSVMLNSKTEEPQVQLSSEAMDHSGQFRSISGHWFTKTERPQEQ